VFFPVYQINKHVASQLHRLRMPNPAVDSSFYVLFIYIVQYVPYYKFLNIADTTNGNS